MELKPDRRYDEAPDDETFNRTSMELKRSGEDQYHAAYSYTFNRTSMELKQALCGLTKQQQFVSFNRTSMELKQS